MPKFKLGEEVWEVYPTWDNGYQPLLGTVETIYIDSKGVQYNVEIDNDYDRYYIGNGAKEENMFLTKEECQAKCDELNANRTKQT